MTIETLNNEHFFTASWSAPQKRLADFRNGLPCKGGEPAAKREPDRAKHQEEAARWLLTHHFMAKPI
jgi:hypothetical protein